MQSRSVFTATVPLPPDAGISGVLLVMVTAHLVEVEVGALTLVVAEPPHPAAKVGSRRNRIGHSRGRHGIRPTHIFVHRSGSRTRAKRVT